MADTEITFSETQATQLAAMLGVAVESLTPELIVAETHAVVRTLARHPMPSKRRLAIRRLTAAGLAV